MPDIFDLDGDRFDASELVAANKKTILGVILNIFGAIQIIRDTLGGGGGFATVSPNDTRGREGV